MKRKPSELTKEEFIVTLDTLYTAASAVQGREAVKLFLRDLLTPSERVMLGRRIIIARMLLAGESYPEICQRLKVGPMTIRRVHTWLRDQFPGYEKAIQAMEKEFTNRAERKMLTKPLTLSRLKKRYPLHFLLFPRSKVKHNFGDYPKR